VQDVSVIEERQRVEGSPDEKIFTDKHERGIFPTPYSLLPLSS
jgi:hypothetical protein